MFLIVIYVIFKYVRIQFFSMPIYTKAGDKGQTSLFGGKRVSKADATIAAVGEIDEFNGCLGLIIAKFENLPRFDKLTEFFPALQNDLFAIGTVLTGGKSKLDYLDARVSEMEAKIDEMEKQLPPLSNFILPGGSEIAACVHVGRSVCRRAERGIVALAKKQTVDPSIIKYFNRLSDLLFMTARLVNDRAGIKEKIWKES